MDHLLWSDTSARTACESCAISYFTYRNNTLIRYTVITIRSCFSNRCYYTVLYKLAMNPVLFSLLMLKFMQLDKPCYTKVLASATLANAIPKHPNGSPFVIDASVHR